MNIFHRRFLVFVILLSLIIGAGTALFLVQREQNQRSGASNQTAIPPQTCGSKPTDIMLIMDRSDSMNKVTGTSGQTKLQAAEVAAQAFVDIIAKENNGSRVGLVSFAPTASLDQQLTTNYSAVKTAIGAMKTSFATCAQCGAITADNAFQSAPLSTHPKIAIFLTDGLANTTTTTSPKLISPTIAEQATIAEIKSGFASQSIAYYTIGLGTDVNTTFLQSIASLTKAQYFFSPTSDQLNQIYQNISLIIGKGNISGTVFNDVNSNGILDTGEQGLDNWKVNLKVGSASSSSMLTALSASASGYVFPGLCDGTYYVDTQEQNSWKQTSPKNPSYYMVSINSGSANTGKNFGMKKQPVCGDVCTDSSSCSGAINECSFCNPTTKKCGPPFTPTPTPSMTPTPTLSPTPTPTPLPQDITLSITVFLHNIGKSGDNANPNAFSFSNKNPLHPTRNVKAFIYDLTNNAVAAPTGSIQYSSTSGSFTGTIDLGTAVAPGKYYIKIQSDYHLRRLIPGILTFTAGTNSLAPISLVAGDADNTNDLSILDYNLLLGCYSVSQSAISCTDAQQVATDFNDDGAVDEKDYNLFIRELSVQNGE